MSAAQKPPEWAPIAWFAGGLPLAGVLAWALKMLLEAQGYGAILVGIFGLFCVLPLTVVTLGLSVWLLARQRPGMPAALAALWAPTLLVLAIGLPLVDWLSEQAAAQASEAARIESERNLPGAVSFVELGANALRPFDEQERPQFVLEPADAASAPHYDGYRLLPGNRVRRLLPEDQNGIRAERSFNLPPPDYARFEAIVRTGPDAPAGAWLLPRQVETAVFVYDDHAESAAVLPWLEDERAVHATRIVLNNYSGQNIARLRLNGWDLQPEILHAQHCSTPLLAWLPERLAGPLRIEWQILGEIGWQQRTLARLPEEPAVAPGQKRLGQTLNMLLGHADAIALRRDISVSEAGATHTLEGPSSTAFTEFQAAYRGCRLAAAVGSDRCGEMRGRTDTCSPERR